MQGKDTIKAERLVEGLPSDPSASKVSPEVALTRQVETFERRDATEDEIDSLPHVVDDIPTAVWIAEFIGAAERVTYYSITTPWQNYMQNHIHAALPGALGLGQATATNINNAFFFFACLTPVPFAIVSDTWLGRYKTLCISLAIYICGCLIMFATSLPTAVQHGAGVGGLATAMVLIGLGLGGVKATISPFIADQYPNLVPQLVKTKKGAFAVTDRTLTIQYIYNVFYWFTNIAGLSSVPSTFLEKERGFWAAFLFPTCFLWIAVILLAVSRKQFVKIPPKGNIIPMAAKTLLCASRHGFKLDNARPLYQAENFGRQVQWDDVFVSEMKRGLIACRVIFSFVLFYVCYNQITTNLVSQAGQMQLVGIPNDTIQALNCIACIILGPLMQNFLYPFLAKRKIPFGPITRVMIGFIAIGASMAYAAGVQKVIYSRGPCYSIPLACPGSDKGRIPNEVNVFVQTPIYFILAAAEILGLVSAREYAYSKAPNSMKAVVQALTQLTAGLGAAIGIAISPGAKDPYLVIFYAALAGATVGVTVFLWILFRKYDSMDEELNSLELRTLREKRREEAQDP